MYSNILVPLDGSEFSECALDHVVAIAQGCKAGRVILLQILEPFYHESTVIGVLGEDFIRETEQKAKDHTLQYLIKKAAELGKLGVKAEAVVREGFAADVILDFAKDENIDLIIMTTHGRSGIARWALGSVADKIIRHASTPIMIVAPRACRTK